MFANLDNDVRLRDVHGLKTQPGTSYHNDNTILGSFRNLRISDHGATMATRYIGDVQPFPLLECPREIRDQIYAEVLLDFPTPSLREQLDCAMLGSAGPLCGRRGIEYALRRLKRTHKIETNILLTNHQVFSEGKEIMLRRGRLVQVTLFNTEILLRLSSCELCLIDAKYGSLCMMKYELHRDRKDKRPPLRPSVFVLCERDIETFCDAIMGETTFEIHKPLSATARQTLAFTTNFHEGNVAPDFLRRHRVHRQALQPFRACLRGFQNVSLQGSSVGLSTVLAATALRDFRSQPVPDLFELLPEVVDMLSLTRELYRAGNPHVCELIAPLEKAIMRCSRAASRWDLWALAQLEIKDPTRHFNCYTSAIYTCLVYVFELIRDYGPFRGGEGLDLNGGIADLYLLEPAIQTYEMCLALPKALGCRDWTPEPRLELHLHADLAVTFAPLRTVHAENEYIMGLALGYKAATRINELMPDDKRAQRWMEWYEGWKSEAVQQGRFYVIDNKFMTKRGIKRWFDVLPGDLVLHLPE